MTSRARSLSLACLCGVAALCVAGPARAQFANHSIGFEAGYLFIDSEVQAGSGPDLGLEATFYLDNGFELYLRTLVGLHKDLAVDPNQTAVGVFPALGVRYLFSEESLRPYLGLAFSYMHFFGGDNLPSSLLAASANAGVEYFFQAETALGLQAEYHRVLALNDPGGNAFAIVAKISWGF